MVRMGSERAHKWAEEGYSVRWGACKQDEGKECMCGAAGGGQKKGRRLLGTLSAWDT